VEQTTVTLIDHSYSDILWSDLTEEQRQNTNGFEFLNLISEHRHGGCMKYTKVLRKKSYWIGLINLVDSVIVSSKFGNAITPQRTRVTGSALDVIQSPKTWTI
jgi:hypothetical protein